MLVLCLFKRFFRLQWGIEAQETPTGTQYCVKVLDSQNGGRINSYQNSRVTFPCENCGTTEKYLRRSLSKAVSCKKEDRLREEKQILMKKDNSLRDENTEILKRQSFQEKRAKRREHNNRSAHCEFHVFNNELIFRAE
jgi:isocitrate dehydrogenase